MSFQQYTLCLAGNKNYSSVIRNVPLNVTLNLLSDVIIATSHLWKGWLRDSWYMQIFGYDYKDKK